MCVCVCVGVCKCWELLSRFKFFGTFPKKIVFWEGMLGNATTGRGSCRKIGIGGGGGRKWNVADFKLGGMYIYVCFEKLPT